MARRRRQVEGQGQFDLDDNRVAGVNRMPHGRLPTHSEQKKLETPYVFTQEQGSLPRPWVSVGSSRVNRARYDDGLGQIHVEFVDGTPWVYEDVPSAVWDAFITSASKGRFIHQVLDQYPYRRGTSMETNDW